MSKRNADQLSSGSSTGRIKAKIDENAQTILADRDNGQETSSDEEKGKKINFDYRKRIVELTLSQLDETLRQKCNIYSIQDDELEMMPLAQFKEHIYQVREVKKQNKQEDNEDEEKRDSKIKSGDIDQIQKSTHGNNKKNKKIETCKKCNLVKPENSNKPKTGRKGKKKKKNTESEGKSNQVLGKITDKIKGMVMKIGIINKIATAIKGIAGIGPKVEQQQLSYKSLMRMIETYHPTNPETREKFSPFDTVHVFNYGMKLSDACGFIKVLNWLAEAKSKLKRALNLKKTKKFKKPATMKDLPDTDSSDDPIKNDTYKGLSEAAIYLGEGAVLYLQTIKTLAILFFILTVINIPLYSLLQSATRKNNFSNVLSALNYFTIGNLGIPFQFCSHSYILYEKSKEEYEKRKAGTLKKPDIYLSQKPHNPFQFKIDLKCSDPEDYVRNYDLIGFIQTLDAKHEKFNKAEEQCKVFTSNYKITKSYESEQQILIYEKFKMNPDMHLPKTLYAVDEECSQATMFQSQAHQDRFNAYFEQKCLEKNNCTLDFSEFNLHEVIATSCLNRIFNVENIRPDFIFISNCFNDHVQLDHFEKESVALIAVFSDIVSISLIYYFFNKLKSLNDEYLEIVDYNSIKMSSFTIQIDNIILDKTMQDMRMLKMKVWLHFQKILDAEGKGSKVVDVQLSITTTQKQMILWQLQKIRESQSELLTQLQQDKSSQEKYNITKELRKMKDKDKRVTSRWNEIIASEQFNKPLVHVSKYNWVYSVDHVWVTFKSTKSPLSILQAYEPVHPIASCLNALCCIKDEIKELVNFNNQKIEVKKAIEPDQIIWINLKYTYQEQTMRSRIVFVLSILTIISTIIITSLSGTLNGYLKRGACQKLPEFSDIYSSQQAYMLTKKVKSGNLEQSVSLSDQMYCYCSSITAGGEEFWFAGKVIPEVQKINPHDETSYCWLYIRELVVSTILLEGSASITAIINSVIAFIFFYLGIYQVKHTSIETQITSFSYILTLEYINMGIIRVIQAFDPTKYFQQLSGDTTTYHGFDYKFYSKVGGVITKTIYLSVILTNIKKTKVLAQILLKRWLDRGLKFNLKKDLEDEDDDEPNSKKKTQAELEALYMGEEYGGEGSLSRMMSHLMVLIAFSAGMPNLYFVGFLFFFFTFMVEKWNLILYSKKTTTLNRIIPLYATSLLNFVILQHLFIGAFMMTNVQIFTVKKSGEDDEDRIKLPVGLENINNQFSVGEGFNSLHQKLYFVFIILAVIFHFAGNCIKGALILILDFIFSAAKKAKDKVKQASQKALKVAEKAAEKAAQNAGPIKMKLMNQKKKVLVKTKTREEEFIEAIGVVQDTKQQIKKMKDDLKKKHDSDSSIDLSDEDVQLKKIYLQLTPYQFLLYAKDVAPIPKHQPEEEKVETISLGAQKIKLYQKKPLITSSLVLIQKMEQGYKKQIYELLIKDNVLTAGDVKREEEIMERFKQIYLVPNASDNIYQEINISNLIKFYKRAKKDFAEINLFFNLNENNAKIVLTPLLSRFAKKDQLRITFEEICYTNKITDDDVKSYLSLLEDRIEDIEDVINMHIDLVKESIIQIKRDQLWRKIRNANNSTKQNENEDDDMDVIQQPISQPTPENVEKLAQEHNQQSQIVESKLKKDPELEFEKFSFEKKLEVLYEYETELLLADRRQRVNRKGIQTICRMQGSISQSYFIIDQEDYKMASKIYYNEVMHPKMKK